MNPMVQRQAEVKLRWEKFERSDCGAFDTLEVLTVWAGVFPMFFVAGIDERIWKECPFCSFLWRLIIVVPDAVDVGTALTLKQEQVIQILKPQGPMNSIEILFHDIQRCFIASQVRFWKKWRSMPLDIIFTTGVQVSSHNVFAVVQFGLSRLPRFRPWGHVFVVSVASFILMNALSRVSVRTAGSWKTGFLTLIKSMSRMTLCEWCVK